MKSPELQKIHRFGLAALVLLLVLAPFHAFLTVSANKVFGHYTIWRLWPEVLLGLLMIGALWLLWRDAALRKVMLASKLTWCLAAYIGWLLITCLWGLGHYHVAKKALAEGLILDTRLPLFFFAAQVFAAHTTWINQRWRKLILIPAAIVVVFGILQIFVLPTNFLAHFGYNPSTVAPFETVDQKLDYVRVQSTLRGANPLGAYLVLVVTALTGIGFWKRKTWARGRFVLDGLLTFVVLVYTYSRSAYIGAVLALAAGSWWMIANKKFKQWAVVGALGVLLVGIGMLFALRHNDRFQNTFFHTDTHSVSAQSSNEARSTALKNGLHDVVQEPLGEGLGTAGPASAHNGGQPARIAENYFLQIGQEAGWLGMGLFVAINGWIAVYLWRLRKAPLARVLLASLIGLTAVNFLSHAWTDETIAILWWTLAGVALAPKLTTSPEVKA